MKTKLFITGLALFAFTSLGYSQYVPSQERGGRNQGQGTSWVDVNKDGICDNYENRVPGQGKNAIKRSGKNQGKHARGAMNRPGQGRNFVDVNSNGVCDYLETSTSGKPKK